MNIFIPGGKYPGLKINVPKSTTLRPTSNLAREALFDILREYSNNEYSFYDLFAGSGAVGIEAASRGFNKAFLIENNLKLYLQIKNLIIQKKINNIYPIKSEVIRFLEKLLKTADPRLKNDLKIFFFDPPYKLTNLYKQTLIMLEKLAKKQNISIIIGETFKGNKKIEIKGLNLFKQKHYGDTRFDFYMLSDLNQENKND